jgi:hypothetical protein
LFILLFYISIIGMPSLMALNDVLSVSMLWLCEWLRMCEPEWRDLLLMVAFWSSRAILSFKRSLYAIFSLISFLYLASKGLIDSSNGA